MKGMDKIIKISTKALIITFLLIILATGRFSGYAQNTYWYWDSPYIQSTLPYFTDLSYYSCPAGYWYTGSWLQNYGMLQYVNPSSYSGFYQSGRTISLNQSIPGYGLSDYYGPGFSGYYPYYETSWYITPSASSLTNYISEPGMLYPSQSFSLWGYNPYSLAYIPPCSRYPQPIYMQGIVQPQARPREYLAVIPEVLHAGQKESISVSLFDGEALTRGRVGVSLFNGSEKIMEASSYINGKGVIGFMVPDVGNGTYMLAIKGQDFEGAAQVQVAEDLIIFIQTDKPIYQPDQTIHIRVLTLNSELKPQSRDVVVDVLDAKGIKIFRKAVLTDAYGMATLDLPVSREPNLGVWKMTATSDQVSEQLDVRIEKYVLPKYEVKVQLPKDWFLVDESISGTIKAEYTFGKPVKGDLEIRASRYVGEWEVYETLTKEIDGETQFDIHPVGYVAGVSGAGGMGNVTLDVVVRERNTGYEEKTNEILTIAANPLLLQIIPESSVFKPSLPFNILVVTETPDHKPSDADVNIKITYITAEYYQTYKTVYYTDNPSPAANIEEYNVRTAGGKATLTFTPQDGAVAIIIDADAGGVKASKALQSGYSPSGNFIHLEQTSQGIPCVGEHISFKVHSTNEAMHFYYEVIARDKVVFSDYTSSSNIYLLVTPMMAPQAKLLVYQILPNSEVAADYLPFSATADYPLSGNVAFSAEEVKPGEDVDIAVSTDGKAKVGIAAVDRSVFILAENRLNLQQVFEELERLYMKPQAELHSTSVYSKVCVKGAADTFKDAGVVVLSNKIVPAGMELAKSHWLDWGGGWFFAFMPAMGNAQFTDSANDGTYGQMPETSGLAEVEKVRQFFPETWLWQELITDNQGIGSFTATVPDSITTWKLQAVAISQDKGLGIYEDDLKTFQPFFIQIDLPYSAIRGEEFPVRVSVYNYLNEKQDVLVEIKPGAWFDLLETASKVISIEANDIGGVQFLIRPCQLGVREVEITARSKDVADAVKKTIIIDPEGVENDSVENFVLSGGSDRVCNTFIPGNAVAGSGRVYVAATSSYLAQTFEGLEGLLQMPFGCGEQNMIFLAPDIYITKYLEVTGQMKPEIMAKAELLMTTGYQRQMTYRRNDGSFSAFGQSDQEGSLWLTAFVLKVFSQAKGLMYIDDNVLGSAKGWITAHQNSDGSFDPVGSLYHNEMIGGMKGKPALTAFAAIALLEAGETSGSAKAIGYLEGELASIDNPYAMALTAYALELGNSPQRDAAYARLMQFAQTDADGLYWPASGADIETTAYALLALIRHGDPLNAGRAAKWLVTRRNPFGGFHSTQDTCIALEALTAYSTGVMASCDLTIQIKRGEDVYREIVIGIGNFDVLQIVDVPINEDIKIQANGTGDAVIQMVKRYNMPAPPAQGQIFDITVDYDTTEVAVNDIVTVHVDIQFNPLSPIEAGMVVLDISVPTGFAAVQESLDDLLWTGRIKRYEIAGRKIIFYIENMLAYECISFDFKVKALYPVKAKGTASIAYSYYKPEMKGEILGVDMTILNQ